MKFFDSALALLTLTITSNNVVNAISLPGKIRGVNLGGVFVAEPWITPQLFDTANNVELYPEERLSRNITAVDEWTLYERLGSEKAVELMEKNWNDFLTKDDLIKLKQNGINSLRIPTPYWFFDAVEGEPFASVSKYSETGMKYYFRALTWAKELGFSVLIDLHTGPGSQNGFDNSGRLGDVQWSKPENQKRTKEVLKKIMLTLSQKDFAKSITGIELLNEPACFTNEVNLEDVLQFNKETIAELDQNTEAKSKFSEDFSYTVHDCFTPIGSEWDSFSDEHTDVQLDFHIYQVFDTGLLSMSKDRHISFSEEYKDRAVTRAKKRPTIVGEFSFAIDDCAQYLNGYKEGTRWEKTGKYATDPSIMAGRKCPASEADFDPEFLKKYAKAQTDGFEHGSGWYFWNFKTGPRPGMNRQFDWDYLYAIEAGFAPTLNQ